MKKISKNGSTLLTKRLFQTFIFKVSRPVIRMHFPHNSHTKAVTYVNNFINSHFTHNVLYIHTHTHIEHAYILGTILRILFLGYLALKPPYAIVCSYHDHFTNEIKAKER